MHTWINLNVLNVWLSQAAILQSVAMQIFAEGKTQIHFCHVFRPVNRGKPKLILGFVTFWHLKLLPVQHVGA